MYDNVSIKSIHFPWSLNCIVSKTMFMLRERDFHECTMQKKIK